MLMAKKRQSGFTLVELLIVIVIIGVLATIGFVAYKNTTGKAQAAVTRSVVTQYTKAIGAFVAEHGEYPQAKFLTSEEQVEMEYDNRFCIGSGYRSTCGPSNDPVEVSAAYNRILEPYSGKPINIAPHDTPLTIDPGGGLSLNITGVAYYYTEPEFESTLDGEHTYFAYIVYALDEPDAQCIGGEPLSLLDMQGGFARRHAKNTLTDGKNTACVVLFPDSVAE